MKPSYNTSWKRIGSVNGITTTYTAFALESDTEYLFRVIATNAEGCSPPLEADDVTKCALRIGKYELIIFFKFQIQSNLCILFVFHKRI